MNKEMGLRKKWLICFFAISFQIALENKKPSDEYLSTKFLNLYEFQTYTYIHEEFLRMVTYPDFSCLEIDGLLFCNEIHLKN